MVISQELIKKLIHAENPEQEKCNSIFVKSKKKNTSFIVALFD